MGVVSITCGMNVLDAPIQSVASEHLGRAVAAVAEPPARLEIEPFERVLNHALAANTSARRIAPEDITSAEGSHPKGFFQKRKRMPTVGSILLCARKPLACPPVT